MNWEWVVVVAILAAVVVVKHIYQHAEPVQPPCSTKLSLHTSAKGIPCS